MSFPANASQGLTEFRLGIDVGGTFTDLVLMDDAGNVTVATNALLERRGARVALLTTAGFRDLLEMREGSRTTGRYDLLSPPPVPLVPRYLRLPIQERPLPSKGTEIPLQPGDVLRNASAGGGGYGDRRQRDPALVARDLHDGLITPVVAREWR